MLLKSEGKRILAGFGYCPSTNNYKVVRINKRIAEVFTLGSGIGWRNAGNMDYDVPAWFQNRGVYVDGAIYWMDKQGTILSLDLADEEFHELSTLPCLPRAGFIPSFTISLQVLGDFLCAFYHSGESWKIWSLKNNKNHQHVIWSEEFSYVNDVNIQPIIFTKSGGILCYDKNVYRYAPEASSPRVLVSFGENVTYFGFLHKHTIVSLKALGEQEKLMGPVEREI
ncbi:F-box/LRR-repeat protein At2g43260-like [Papaver somniferum]|uniref:F-box/LRR-repeat protein At2g43260-like n=1 Tax=Papaver somniferum TaxID=3469 RepID=UPI000E6FC493|nr:F-box/LRR-repeat protein At2g43260-like [Papaver somniferum]